MLDATNSASGFQQDESQRDTINNTGTGSSPVIDAPPSLSFDILLTNSSGITSSSNPNSDNNSVQQLEQQQQQPPPTACWMVKINGSPISLAQILRDCLQAVKQEGIDIVTWWYEVIIMLFTAELFSTETSQLTCCISLLLLQRICHQIPVLCSIMETAITELIFYDGTAPIEATAAATTEASEAMMLSDWTLPPHLAFFGATTLFASWLGYHHYDSTAPHETLLFPPWLLLFFAQQDTSVLVLGIIILFCLESFLVVMVLLWTCKAIYFSEPILLTSTLSILLILWFCSMVGSTVGRRYFYSVSQEILDILE